MSRFAKKQTTKFETDAQEYEHGYHFSTSNYAHITKPGLSREVVQEISHIKGEPQWMLDLRLRALEQFEAKGMPPWGADLSQINFDEIRYYLRATDEAKKSWDQVPPEVKTTFDRLGIPEAEQSVLAGVKAQYDCLTADSMVFTDKGIKKIVDITTNDVVFSLNESTGLLEKQRVLGLASKGERVVYEVKTQGGRTIEVTNNHPFYSLQRYTKPNSVRGRYKKEWKYLSHLNVGDLIGLVTEIPDSGKSFKLPKIEIPLSEVKSRNQFTEYTLNIENRYAKLRFPAETNEDLMWLLGFYLGDGFLGGKVSNESASKYTRVCLAVSASDQQLRDEIKNISKKLFDYKPLVSSKDCLVLNSVLFVQMIEKLGLTGSALTKKIPKWVFSLPKSQKLAFIGGYFDADGNIRSGNNNALVFTSISKEILNSLKLLAISCGLNPSHIWDFQSNYTYRGTTKINSGYRVQISGQISLVGSRCLRKRQNFQERKYIHKFRTAKGTDFRSHVSEHLGFAKILSIKEIGKKPVYDIEVEGHHNFVANGLIVHNSEVVYGSLKEVFAKDGVVFLSMDEGLQQYPDLVKEYFGRVIPSADNKFAALNTATWSGGSFVYVPPGVEVKMPLQTYFRINAENAGQFERTLIIVDEGAKVHYIEGCFTAGTKILTERGLVAIEDVTKEDMVFTHQGKYESVYHTQVRPYSGKLYTVGVTGNPSEAIEATEEHPFLVVRRKYKNDRNKVWKPEWVPIKDVNKGDYLCTPIDRSVNSQDEITFEVPVGNGRHGWQLDSIKVRNDEKLFSLIGYYLAEGSISAGSYLNFSFSKEERECIDDVKQLLNDVFGVENAKEVVHAKNNGVSVVVGSVRLCRIFEQFGTHAAGKNLPTWVMQEDLEKQAALVRSWYRGDGNYYRRQNKHGFKEVFRINTVSQTLAHQGRTLLARLGVASSLNKQERAKTGRQSMHVLVVSGEYMIPFGLIVDQPVQPQMWGKKRATSYFIDEKYLYAPVKSIQVSEVENIDVYNFSVNSDESYTAGGVAVHNCTAPNFSSNSLHSAVVEIFVKKGARCQYTTVQNWYKNIYNLVTKRAWVEEEGEMIWTDFNMGSKVTMKYPSFVLAGKGARGETLSMALAGAGQHQDTGSKAIHLAPYTSSSIVSKSISKDGGRTSYRGLVNIGPNAHGSKNTVICDALLLDDRSRSDTYPIDKIFNSDVTVQHEATVSKIGDDQLFYLMSRGITEENASKMIVNGFIDDLVRQLPLEYAVEMNRLIEHEMEGSIG